MEGCGRFPCADGATFVITRYNDAGHTATNTVEVVLRMQFTSERVIDEIDEFWEVDARVVC